MIFRRSLLVPVVALALAPFAFGQQAVPSGGVLAPRLATPRDPKVAPNPAPDTVLPQDIRTGTPESPLMPDQTPSLVKPDPAETKTEKEKKTKTSKTEVFEQDQADKIRFRQVYTQALGDPKVIAQWDKANVQRKDADKRAILKEYYKLLYARMARIDPSPSLKKIIDLQAVTADHRLTQTRITPTESSGDAGETSTSGRVFAE